MVQVTEVKEEARESHNLLRHLAPLAARLPNFQDATIYLNHAILRLLNSMKSGMKKGIKVLTATDVRAAMAAVED